jgi:hypothetical protein
MREKITCELFSRPYSLHLEQLYTGFGILYRKGIIQLIQRICKGDVETSHLKVVMNGESVLYYDTEDSPEINNEVLKEVDFYFKRSYSDEEIGKLNDREKEKIFPLGLNYPVFSRGFDALLIKRVAVQKGIGKLLAFVEGMGIDYFLGGNPYIPRVNRLEFYPALKLPPKVLFMIRAWDPSKLKPGSISSKGENINDTRAQCVRMLKREFGKRFLGGFRHDDYSRERFSDCLLSDNNLAKKKNYMKLLREFPICIATTGLHGSIGFKLAEYVCYSKAIVTERLNCRVPGHFEKELNYLEFVSPNGCLESTIRLFQDHKLRQQLMINNYRYYQSYLRPDSLVLNTLAIAMSSAISE